jgi:hypothetical protein
VPKVIEPPGPADRDDLARQRGEHLRALTKAATTHQSKHAAAAHEQALARVVDHCSSLKRGTE